VNNDYLSKFYELGYTHSELEALLKKLSDGEVFTKEEHARLSLALGMIDGLSTFNGSYESLTDKPDIIDVVKQSNEFVSFPALNSKVRILGADLEKSLRQVINEMMFDMEQSKADIEHSHDNRYSLLNHDHAGVYSLSNHNHTDVYSLLNHDHAGIYTTKEEVNMAIRDVIQNEDLDINAKGGDCAYVGSDMPDDNDKIWFCDDSKDVEDEFTYSNPLINELFSCIRSLQDQVAQLQKDVEYLKINGGGGSPIEPDDPSNPEEPDKPEVITFYLALEDGGLFELEEGGHIILEQEQIVEVVKEPTLMLEDGFRFLLEDGGYVLLEESISTVQENLLLLETGALLLLENGANIKLEK
jgi:plasmid maintenance system killer protein